ncbi:hypothetical protein SH2C18_03780 [Clostridium sediminicola]
MAKRVARIYSGNPYINEFDFNESSYKSNDLNVKIFESPTKEWQLLY